MFKDNSLKGVHQYFQDKLEDLYDFKEIRQFFEWSCEHFYQLSKADVLLNERRFSESELLDFRSIVKRLQVHEPIQHIIGEVEFFGTTYKVNEHVLIPRPETEELIDLIIRSENPKSILDVGTGSGVIPISLKSHFPGAEVYGLDVSVQALQTAAENAEYNLVKVHWVQMDILQERPRQKFDLIVSNPPYVLESDKKDMHPNVLKYDPALALFVKDEEALIFYERIVEISEECLLPDGKLYFEIHERFGEEVCELLSENRFESVELIQDIHGKDRIVRAQKSPNLK